MSDLDKILAEIDLPEWLDEQGISYRSVIGGTNFQIKECPFCGDSRWKVYIGANKRGLCYHGSCGRSFNLFSFAREHLGVDSKETAKHFEAYARSSGFAASTPKKIVAAPTTEGWRLPLSIELPTPDGSTHPYLTKRHITVETQERYQLRWCESGHYSFKDEHERVRSQDFSQRIIIPVADLDGVVQSFQGRAVWDVDEDAGERRYLFPSGLPGTGRFLYGGNLVIGKPNLVIGEGPPDTWAIHQALENHPDFTDFGAIGSFGLSIGQGSVDGNDQLSRIGALMRSGLRRVWIMWDGEHGALMSALEAAKTLKSVGLTVRIALLPADRDPNEVPTSVVRDAIEDARLFNALTYVEWKIEPPYSPK